MYTGATMSNYRSQIVFNHTEDFRELNYYYYYYYYYY